MEYEGIHSEFQGRPGHRSRSPISFQMQQAGASSGLLEFTFVPVPLRTQKKDSHKSL